MTPKQKACELIDYYRCELIDYVIDYSVADIISKKQVLILIDNIIKELEQFYPQYESWFLVSKIDYWLRVRRDINEMI